MTQAESFTHHEMLDVGDAEMATYSYNLMEDAIFYSRFV